MSKELSPLEALNNLTQLAFNYAENNGCLENAKEYFNIIETALKRLEQAENCVFTSKEDVKKELKALEIIKKKRVDVFQLLIAIKVNNLNEYNKRHAKYLQLTQEEFDLLREVLL